MTEAISPPDERRIYAEAYEVAKRHALRHVASSQASEVAHDVAVAVLHWRLSAGVSVDPSRSISAFIYRAVINRLRDGHRRRGSREAAEQLHATEMHSAAPTWANPLNALEAEELAAVVRDAIAGMPAAMRTVFLLVREQDRSYKEVAAELNLAVGTVHTQISRAYAVLRLAIEQYRGDGTATRPRSPVKNHLRTSA